MYTADIFCSPDIVYSCNVELFQVHYHPSVSLFAHRVISGEVINYSGDPLHDFTLIRFLDRFVYRNPKKTDEQKDGK